MTVASFSSIDLSANMKHTLQGLGYDSPTPIQAKTIPLLLEGRDVTGQSQTGSGKTAAFGIPLIERIDMSVLRPQGLILCPTRELAVQVATELKRLGRHINGLRVVAIYGGEPIRTQFAALERGAHILIATPGRLLDHKRRGSIDLAALRMVVLDEADRMLDMGFIDDIKSILETLPQERQTALFSATFPDAIQNLVQSCQRSPVVVEVENLNVTVDTVEQVYYETGGEDKPEALHRILQKQKAGQTIVFCNTRRQTDDLARFLKSRKYGVDKLHGEMEQRDRDRVMLMFRNRSLEVLVATDVAARGLDVASLDVVINYDLPLHTEDYVHRVGRTGRAGKSGLAVSLVSPDDQFKLDRLQQDVSGNMKALPLPEPVKPGSQLLTDAKPMGAPMETLVIFAGKRDKIRPTDILGALTGEAGRLRSDQIGKIDIFDNYTYVAIERTVAMNTLDAMRNNRIKGRRLRVEVARSP